MTDYNDPFEQVGEIPVFDWNAAAAARRKPPILTCPTCGANSDELGCQACDVTPREDA